MHWSVLKKFRRNFIVFAAVAAIIITSLTLTFIFTTAAASAVPNPPEGIRLYPRSKIVASAGTPAYNDNYRVSRIHDGTVGGASYVPAEGTDITVTPQWFTLTLNEALPVSYFASIVRQDAYDGGWGWPEGFRTIKGIRVYVSNTDPDGDMSSLSPADLAYDSAVSGDMAATSSWAGITFPAMTGKYITVQVTSAHQDVEVNIDEIALGYSVSCVIIEDFETMTDAPPFVVGYLAQGGKPSLTSTLNLIGQKSLLMEQNDSQGIHVQLDKPIGVQNIALRLKNLEKQPVNFRVAANGIAVTGQYWGFSQDNYANLTKGDITAYDIAKKEYVTLSYNGSGENADTWTVPAGFNGFIFVENTENVDIQSLAFGAPFDYNDSFSVIVDNITTYFTSNMDEVVDQHKEPPKNYYDNSTVSVYAVSSRQYWDPSRVLEKNITSEGSGWHTINEASETGPLYITFDFGRRVSLTTFGAQTRILYRDGEAIKKFNLYLSDTPPVYSEEMDLGDGKFKRTVSDLGSKDYEGEFKKKAALGEWNEADFEPIEGRYLTVEVIETFEQTKCIIVMPSVRFVADPAKPAVPRDFVSTGKNADSITLDWYLEWEYTYNIYLNGSKLNTDGIGYVPYTVSGLEPDTEYEFTVTAFDGALESDPSEPLKIRTEAIIPSKIEKDTGYVDPQNQTEKLKILRGNTNLQNPRIIIKYIFSDGSVAITQTDFGDSIIVSKPDSMIPSIIVAIVDVTDGGNIYQSYLELKR